MHIWSILFLSNVNYSFFLLTVRSTWLPLQHPPAVPGVRNTKHTPKHRSLPVSLAGLASPAQLTPMPDGLSRFRTMNFPPFSAPLWYSPFSLCEHHHLSTWSQVPCICNFPTRVHCSTNINFPTLPSPSGFLFHLILNFFFSYIYLLFLRFPLIFLKAATLVREPC